MTLSHAANPYRLRASVPGCQSSVMAKRRSSPPLADAKPIRGATLGARIYAARTRAGLSKADVQRAMGLKTWHMVHWWETDKHEPRGYGVLRKLAEVLRVTPEELLGIAEGQEPPFEAWEAFKRTPTYAELSDGQRRALRGFAWPPGEVPTVESYRWLVESLKTTRPA